MCGLIVSAICEQLIGTTSNDVKITDDGYQRPPWREGSETFATFGYTSLFWTCCHRPS